MQYVCKWVSKLALSYRIWENVIMTMMMVLHWHTVDRVHHTQNYFVSVDDWRSFDTNLNSGSEMRSILTWKGWTLSTRSEYFCSCFGTCVWNWTYCNRWLEFCVYILVVEARKIMDITADTIISLRVHSIYLAPIAFVLFIVLLCIVLYWFVGSVYFFAVVVDRIVRIPIECCQHFG